MSDFDQQSDKSFDFQNFDKEIFNNNFIDTDEFNVPRSFSSVNFSTEESSTSDGNMKKQQQQKQRRGTSYSNSNSIGSENSYTMTSFSLGDVGAYLKLDIEASKDKSMDTEDDDIAEELLNLNELEKELAFELENLETCSTPSPER